MGRADPALDREDDALAARGEALVLDPALGLLEPVRGRDRAAEEVGSPDGRALEDRPLDVGLGHLRAALLDAVEEGLGSVDEWPDAPVYLDPLVSIEQRPISDRRNRR